MLMEMAMGLQHKLKSPEQLFDAEALYDCALKLCAKPETDKTSFKFFVLSVAHI